MPIRPEPAGSWVKIPQRHPGVTFSFTTFQSMGTDMAQTRRQFRQYIRQQRNQLDETIQMHAAAQLLSQCQTLPELAISQHIALYLSNDGEIDTQPLIELLWSQGKQVYLPVLHPFSPGHLLFLHYHQHTPMMTNKYGIFEPKLDQTQVKPIEQLDLVFTPLVGFDSQGHRLGMGGGYYDRSLARWFATGVGPTPIGLAHDCQHVERLPTEEWDVPLPKIVTPSRIWHWEFKH